MRLAVLATVQLLDGFANTALNVRGGLPELLAGAGFREVSQRGRLRTLTGTYEILTLRSDDGQVSAEAAGPRA